MEHSSQLLRLGLSPNAAEQKTEFLHACDAALGSLGAAATRWSVWVPGRIELLGKHTDYAGGRSLLCAVERGFVVRAALRQDGRVRAVDARTHESCDTLLDPTVNSCTTGWPRYVETVAHRLARNFSCATRGVDLAFYSDLPPAAGMSSSSALLIAVFVSLAKSNDLRSAEEFRREISSREELASYLGCIENGESFRSLDGDAGVGTFGGSQDHTAIMCSEPGRVVQYAFSPVRREGVFALPPGYVLAVASSGVTAEKAAGARDAYNNIALRIRKLVSRWNEDQRRSDATLADAIGSGAQATGILQHLAAADADPRMTPRLEQFLLEAFDLIPRAAAALSRGSVDEFGRTADRSQEAAEELLGNQIPETVRLAALARSLGAPAASAFGAGFGGSVWALHPAEGAEPFLRKWEDAYAREFPSVIGQAEFFLSPAGPGASQW